MTIHNIRHLIRTPDSRTWRKLGLPSMPSKAPLPPPNPPRLCEQAGQPAALHQIAHTLGVLPGCHRIIKTPDCLRNVVVRYEKLKHLVDKEHAHEHREVWANRIESTLADPLEVWLVEKESGGRPVYRRHFIAEFDDQRCMFAAVQENTDGAVLWTFFRNSRIDPKREGLLLYRRV